MPTPRKALAAGGTFAAALAIGLLTQHGEAIASRFIDPEDTGFVPRHVGDPGPEVSSSLVPGFTGPPQAEATPGTLPGGRLDRPDLPKTPTRLATLDLHGELQPAIGRAGESCATQLTAEVRPAALVELSLSSPCARDVPATVHHKGLMFTLLTDGAGEARVLVPALSEQAVFIVALEGHDGGVATAEVPEVRSYDRAALQWRGESGLSIHAFEFGAGYETDGHVWRAAARGPSASQGFLVGLGDAAVDNGFRAEVYSFPSGKADQTGTVGLSVEAEVTPSNCGREVSAQSIQSWPGRPAETRDLLMTVPDCDATGDFLVLKNLLKDLNIGAR